MNKKVIQKYLICYFLLPCILISFCSAQAEETVSCPHARIKDEAYTLFVSRETPIEGDEWGNTLMIGDSICDELDFYGVLDEVEIEALIGATMYSARFTKMIKRSGAYFSQFDLAVQKQPDRLLIMLGSNAIDHLPMEMCLSDMHTLMDDLLDALPDCDFYFFLVTPIESIASAEYSYLTMDAIRQFNDELQKMCAEHGVHALDAFTGLLNAKGDFANSSLIAFDGIHLMPEGAEMLGNIIRMQIAPLE